MKKQSRSGLNLTSQKNLVMVLVGMVGVLTFTKVALGQVQQHQQVLGDESFRDKTRMMERQQKETNQENKQVSPTVTTTSVTTATVTPTVSPTSTSTITPTPTSQVQQDNENDTEDNQVDEQDNNDQNQSGGEDQKSVIINSDGTTTHFVRTESGDFKEAGKQQSPENKQKRVNQEQLKKTLEDKGLSIDDLKIFYEQQDGKVVAKTEKADGTKVDLNGDILEKVNERLQEDNIQVATDSSGQFVLKRGSVGAQTSLPISLNLATNSLIVTTPNGIKTVAVLPDKAVQNLLAHDSVSVVDGIKLVSDNGAPTYQIDSDTKKKILGFISVNVKKQFQISAENGDVLNVNQSPLSWILDRLSR